MAVVKICGKIRRPVMMLAIALYAVGFIFNRAAQFVGRWAIKVRAIPAKV